MPGAVTPGLVAVAIGALLCVVLFVPFVAISYRRRGRLTMWRTAVWAWFVVYGLALWTYTLLPLPSVDEITCAPPQLNPLAAFAEIGRYDTSSIAAILRNPAFLQVALNVLLFVPLGFFLRLLWGLGWRIVVPVGLGISILIELTQLTGVWGLYPCAYRVFDTADLLTNTAGAALGAALAALIPAGMLSPALQPDAAEPRPVTSRRRLLAMGCDALVLVLIGTAITIAVRAWQIYVQGTPVDSLDPSLAAAAGNLVPWLLLLVVTLTTGGTLGDHATRLRFVPRAPGLAATRRLLRFMGGIGGYGALVLVDAATSLPVSIGFAVLAVALAVFTVDHRGLAGIMSGQQLTDARATAASAKMTS